MRIISSEEKVYQISCQCGTHFEYDFKDIGMKGDYGYCYFVNCPTCNEQHVLSLSSEEEEGVRSYIDKCRSCRSCKFMSIVREGYSDWTVTNIDISCKLQYNKRLPLSGYETGSEKEYAYAFAEQCTSYTKGKNYEKGVEQSELDANRQWEESNRRQEY